MFMQSNYVRLLSGRGVVGLAVVYMLVVIGGFALHEALWRRVVGVSAPRVVQFPPSWLSSSNFACNSPTTLSNPEIRSLELQRFQTLLKLHPIELRAKFGGGGVVAAQGSQPGPAARGCRSQAMSARWAGCLKPLSPLLACIRVEVKPPSPLRERKGCFWRIFPAQR